MKPDWKSAPEWAKWLAMDEDGKWYWFEDEPEIDGGVWTTPYGVIAEAFFDGDWDETLEARP